MKTIAASILVGLVWVGIPSCNSINSPPSSDPAPVDAQTQPIIKIAGSSSITTVLKLLAEVYQAQQNVKIEFISSSQSGGAIAALKNDVVDIAGSSHVLNPEEDNGQIQSRELAKDLLTVATHESVTGVDNLTTEQLRAIYQGKITNWQEVGGPDAEIVVLDRPEDESAKMLLRQYYLGEDQTTATAIVLNREGELIETLQSTPHSIGAFSLAYSIIHQLPVNRLSLNGTAPNVENFTSGQYAMVRQLSIIWSKQPSPETQEFLNFIFSEEGARILQERGFVTAK